MKRKHPIGLGDIAIDTLTGFKGVVVAITKWLHGCERITIQPQTLHDGKTIDPISFDEPQIEVVSPKQHRSTDRTGGPKPEPSRGRNQ